MPQSRPNEFAYERRDASVRVITWFAAGLVVAAVLMHLSIAGLFHVFKTKYPSPDAPSRIALNPRNVAPSPQLQTNPQMDLAEVTAAQNKQLHSYGWIDHNGGIIHIPIERAMELIAQRGLPTRGPGTNNSSGITPEQLQQQKAVATAPKP